MEIKLVDIKEYERFRDLKPCKAESIPYLREEKNGYFSMLSNNGDPNYSIINKTSKQILDLCDGNKSVDNLWNIMCDQYTNVPKDMLKKDLLIALGELTRLNAIEWESKDNMSTNPFVLKASAVITDQISVSLAGENDIRDISSFLGTFIKNYNETDESDYKYFWGTDYREYTSPMIVRQCLYSYFKDFFVVKQQGDVLGLVVVKPANELFLHDATIQMFDVPKELFKSVIFEIMNYYAAFPFKKITSLKVLLAENYVNSNSQIVEELAELGFSLNCVGKKEYGDGEDLHTYSIQLNTID